MRFACIAAVSCTVLAIAAGQAGAGLIIDAGPASGQQSFSGGNYVAGSEFTTASALTIRSLGWLDVEGDGLLYDHVIGLWDTVTQALLASATVTSMSGTVTSAEGTGIWYLEDISPVTLAPGATYRVAGEVGAGTHLALTGDKIGNGVTFTSGYVRTSFPSGGFNYPDLSFSAQAIRAGLSTDFVTPIPEPSALAVTALGLFVIGFGTVRRRRRP